MRKRTKLKEKKSLIVSIKIFFLFLCSFPTEVFILYLTHSVGNEGYNVLVVLIQPVNMPHKEQFDWKQNSFTSIFTLLTCSLSDD